MTIKITRFLPAGLLLALSSIVAMPAMAWSNHALGTWQALSSVFSNANMPDVRAENLTTFLSAEAQALALVLNREEQWARTNVPGYPQRPEALAYRPVADMVQTRARFLAALRINPNVKLPLYLQLKPGTDLRGKAPIHWSEVTTLENATSVKHGVFLRVQEGELVSALDIVASGSDEPDYGLDLGLWDNNLASTTSNVAKATRPTTSASALAYGFGKQPFGNPALEYSSQAPFHMGFFHESPIVYQAASFLRRTYPEYRIHLYQTLAAHAFASGHPYWGWRFAGWALHYVQDLTQPYHAMVLPGISVSRMLWVNAMDLLGAHESKQQLIMRVSNRHAALENYQYRRMRAAYLSGDKSDALLRAAADNTPEARHPLPPYSSASVRQVISLQSHDAADATDAALEKILPAKYISDPRYVFGETEPEIDLFALVATFTPEQQKSMTNLATGLMRNFGTHSRSFIRALPPPSSPRRTPPITLPSS